MFRFSQNNNKSLTILTLHFESDILNTSDPSTYPALPRGLMENCRQLTIYENGTELKDGSRAGPGYTNGKLIGYTGHD